MSDSLITSKALASSIKQLMETTALSKISIQEIVDNCGVNRQTFYYHFKDKFDLVNWIYYYEVTKLIADKKHYENWSDGMVSTLTYLMKNKAFYINALNTPGQNDFDGYFFEFCFELIKGVVNDLSSEMTVSDKNKRFIADFYTHAFVGITIQWIKGGMKEAPKEIVIDIENVVKGSMIGALKRYNY